MNGACAELDAAGDLTRRRHRRSTALDGARLVKPEKLLSMLSA
jgi:hypothetical protein